MLRVNNGCWINVEERVPRDGIFVFVTDGKTVDVGYFLSEDNEWIVNFDALDSDGIEAWMPWPSDPNDFYVFTGRDS